MLQISDPMLNS